jgi:hypothetical protein
LDKNVTEIKITCKNCSTEQTIVVGGSTSEIKCRSCNCPLFEVRDVNGYVYVLSNPSMFGLLKIGYTERTVEERVNELNRETGVPSDFIIECYFSSNRPQQMEARIHRRLSEYRLQNKEFFNIDFNGALGVIKEVLNKEPVFIQKHRDEVRLEQDRKERLEQDRLEKQRLKREQLEQECKHQEILELEHLKQRRVVEEVYRQEKTSKEIQNKLGRFFEVSESFNKRCSHCKRLVYADDFLHLWHCINPDCGSMKAEVKLGENIHLRKMETEAGRK